MNRPGLTVISHRLRIPGKNREKGRRTTFMNQEFFFLLQKLEDIKQKIQF
jgi:hypothetical protein